MGKKKGGAEGGKPKFSVLDLGKKAEGEEKKPKGPTKKEKRLAKQKLEEAKRNAKVGLEPTAAPACALSACVSVGAHGRAKIVSLTHWFASRRMITWVD